MKNYSECRREVENIAGCKDSSCVLTESPLTESPSSTFYTVECDCDSVFQTVYLDK